MARCFTKALVAIAVLAVFFANGCGNQSTTENSDATDDGGSTSAPLRVANDDGEIQPEKDQNESLNDKETTDVAAAAAQTKPPPIETPEWKPPPRLTAAIAKFDSIEAPGELISLDGEWRGYLASYPGPVGVKLSINPGGSSTSERQITTVDKEFREHLHKKLYSKKYPFSRQIPYAPMASFAPKMRTGIARQVFHDPEGKETVDQEVAAVADMQLGWMLFQPERDRKSRAYQIVPTTYICSVVPADGDRPETLIGWYGDNRNGDSFFVLTRSEAADYLMKPIYDSFGYLKGGPRDFVVADAATLPVFKKMGLPQPNGKPSPFLESIDAWKSRLADEYPEVKEFERLNTSLSYRCGLNLFEDEYFKKHFGVSYFDLPESDSATIFDSLGNAVLKRPFTSSGSFGRIDIVQKLVAHREIRRYQQWLQKKLATLEAFPECGQWLDAQEQMAKLQMYPVWPSEQQEVDEAFLAARKRLAGPVLRSIAAKQVSELTGRRGAFALSTFRHDNRQFLDLASDSDREEVLGWLERRRDYLAGGLAKVKLLQLTKFGDDVGDLPKISQWRKDMIEDYAPVIDTAPFSLLRDHIRYKRGQIITHHEKELQQKLADIKSTRSVDAFLDRYLSEAEDRTLKASERLIALADERKRDIDFQTFKSQFSEREWKWRETGEVDLSDGGPTAEEIRLAVFREIKQIGGNIIDGHNVEYTYPSIARYGISIFVRIDEVEVGKRTQVDNSDSWRCEWKVTKGDAELSKEARELAGGDNRGFSYVSLIEGLLSSMLNGMTKPSKDVFEATPNGWRSREIRLRAQQGKMFVGSK